MDDLARAANEAAQSRGRNLDRAREHIEYALRMATALRQHHIAVQLQEALFLLRNARDVVVPPPRGTSLP